MEYLRLFPRHHFARNPLVAWQNVGCFIRLNKNIFYLYQQILNASVIFKGTLHAVYLHYLNFFPTEFFFPANARLLVILLPQNFLSVLPQDYNKTTNSPYHQTEILPPEVAVCQFVTNSFIFSMGESG